MIAIVPRRLIELGSVFLALVALGFVLYNATLVDRRAPSIGRISLSATAGGDERLAQTLTAIAVEFTEEVRTGSVERRLRIDPYVPGTLAWDGHTTLTFTPAENLPQDTAFTLSVEPGFEDLAGNVATTGLDAWEFRTVGPPAILSTEPAAGTADVAVDTTILLTFDRLMDTAAVERALRIEPAVANRASWSGPALTLVFAGPLAFGTTYTVSVGTEAADTGGSHLETPFELRFTTVAAGLAVATTVPAPNVAGVSVRTPIAIVFGAPVDPESVEGSLRITPPVAGDLRIVELPDDRVPAGPEPTRAPADALRVLMLSPSGPLAAHTTYTVTLDPVVQRLGSAGVVAAGRTWSFTTGGPTASAHNHVAFLSPRGGVLNVWLMNPDGSSPRQLTTELVPVTGFDVTADGGTVAWAAGGVIRVMRVDGTDTRTVTREGTHEYAPTFAPDGRSLLVGRRGAGALDEGFWLVPVPGLAEGPERQVLSVAAPPIGSVALEGDGIDADGGLSLWAPRATFDPGGRFVLLAHGESQIVDLSADLPLVTALHLELRTPAAWSNMDGGFLGVGTDDPEAQPGLFLVTPSGQVARLRDLGPPELAPAGAVAVAPSGAIALVVDPDGDGRTHVAFAPGPSAEPVALTLAGDLVDGWPAFSPDGGELLFVRVRAVARDRSEGIWAVLPDGRELRRLATDGSFPRWLP